MRRRCGDPSPSSRKSLTHGVPWMDSRYPSRSARDAEIEPGWARTWRELFARDGKAAIAFGSVVPADYDRASGFIPAYRARSTVASSLAQKCSIEGMGACMAIRRSAWQDLAGFDEALGSGARFFAGEETDFVVRALLRGWNVVESPDVAVRHSGFRDWSAGRDLIAGYMFGLGAVNMKMLRLGGAAALPPLRELAWRWLFGRPVVDLNQTPSRCARLVAFLRGARKGMMSRLDSYGHFQ